MDYLLFILLASTYSYMIMRYDQRVLWLNERVFPSLTSKDYKTTMPDKKIDNIHEQLQKTANSFGSLFISVFHYTALFAIGGVIAWAAFLAFMKMFHTNSFKIEDILTLFIYLELGAMVGIYFKTQRMPVRYLIYVAITALTRLLILGVAEHDPDLNSGIKILMESGAILFLCIAVFIVRMAALKYPSPKDDVEEQV